MLSVFTEVVLLHGDDRSETIPTEEACEIVNGLRRLEAAASHSSRSMVWVGACPDLLHLVESLWNPDLRLRQALRRILILFVV